MAALYTHLKPMQPTDYHSATIDTVATKAFFVGMLSQGPTPKNWTDEWALEAFPTGGNPTVAEGADKTDGFGYEVPFTLKGMLQVARSAGWHVTKQSMRLAQAEWEKGNGRAKQQAADARNFWLQLEKMLLSMQEARDYAAGVARRTRAAPTWLLPTAHAIHDIDASIRPTVAQYYTGAFEDYTEAEMKKQLLACSLQRGEPVSLFGHVGLELKTKMSTFPFIVPKSEVVDDKREVSMPNAKKLSLMVDIFEYDGATVRTAWMPRLFCNHEAENMPTTDYTNTSGLFIDPTMWDLAFSERVHHVDCSTQLDTGGGPRGYHEAELRLRCKNPMGQFTVYSKKLAAMAAAAAPAA